MNRLCEPQNRFSAVFQKLVPEAKAYQSTNPCFIQLLKFQSRRREVARDGLVWVVEKPELQ
jgi:hypothetical protein